MIFLGESLIALVFPSFVFDSSATLRFLCVSVSAPFPLNTFQISVIYFIRQPIHHQICCHLDRGSFLGMTELLMLTFPLIFLVSLQKRAEGW